MPNEQKRDRVGAEGNRTYHVPVMLKEAVDAMSINPSGVYVDCTFGGGGHSREILSRLSDKGKLFSFDQDLDALKNTIDDPKFTLINQNFRFLENSILVILPLNLFHKL